MSEEGFQLHPRRGSKKQAECLTDTEFADDIALIAQSLEHALLHSLEETSNFLGLHLNETTFLANNKHLSQIEDYKYLGSSSEKDISIRPVTTCITTDF